jgi:drug/metabolite transporter (DMT)-like permease
MPTSWWARICAGVALVSFFTPALTNYAMFQVALALLLTLESVGPLYSLPLCFLLEGEKPSLRASLGAVLAVAGIAILAARGDAETAV